MILYLNIWNLWFSKPFVAEEKNNPRTVIDNAGIRFSLFFVYTGANFALRELTHFFDPLFAVTHFLTHFLTQNRVSSSGMGTPMWIMSCQNSQQTPPKTA